MNSPPFRVSTNSVDFLVEVTMFLPNINIREQIYPCTLRKWPKFTLYFVRTLGFVRERYTFEPQANG